MAAYTPADGLDRPPGRVYTADMTGRVLRLALAALVAVPPAAAERIVGAAPDTLAVLHREGGEPLTWAPAATMNVARFVPSVARIKGGRILAAGGFDQRITSLPSVEVYDPATDRWTRAAPMARSRYTMVFAVLKDGRVLAAGGRQNTNNVRPVDIPDSEIYDPDSDSWSATGAMLEPLDGALTFVRPDGKVLAVGGGYADGIHTSKTQLFDPRTGRWSEGPPLGEPRISAAGVTLKDGRFLIAGGSTNGATLSSAEIYDPRRNSWSRAAPMRVPRYGHTLTLLHDGRVLAAGGSISGGGTPTAEVYDPAVDSWADAPGLRHAHSHGATVVVEGKVYLIGGTDAGGDHRVVDIFDPATDSWSHGPALSSPRVMHAAELLSDGRALVFGGGTGGYPSPAMASTVLLRHGRPIEPPPELPPSEPHSAPPPAVYTPAPYAAAPVTTYVPTPPPLPMAPPPSAAPRFTARSPERPHDYALIVGVGYYKSLPAADYAENDAREVAAAVRALGVPEENTVSLIGAKATLSEVSKYVEEWLPRRVSPDSRVYFFYSGHGSPDIKDGTAYMMPWDGDPAFVKSTGFPLQRLYDALSALKAARVVAMIDSCFSGAGGRSVLVAGVRPLVTVKLPDAPSPKITVLTAAEGEEVAGSLPERGHGLFSYYLIQGLTGAAAPDAEHLTVDELYSFVRKGVILGARRQNREQNPTLRTPNGKLRLY